MVRRAAHREIDTIMSIYHTAVKYMRDNGNPDQWGDGYPSRTHIENDIEQERLYVCEADGVICGVFAFIIGAEPNYLDIENGAWDSNEPYGTIHRIASNGIKKGVFEQCMEFCVGRISHIRIDTHKNNSIMLYLIEKNGFKKCGTIRVEDGTPRVAYELTAPAAPNTMSMPVR